MGTHYRAESLIGAGVCFGTITWSCICWWSCCSARAGRANQLYNCVFAALAGDALGRPGENPRSVGFAFSTFS